MFTHMEGGAKDDCIYQWMGYIMAMAVVASYFDGPDQVKGGT